MQIFASLMCLELTIKGIQCDNYLSDII